MDIARQETRFRNSLYRLKGAMLKAYLHFHGCKVDNKLKCKRFPIFRTVPQKNFFIGNNVTIGFNITFDIHEGGRLVIGDRVNLTQDILICARSEVSIGEDTLVAENVSIRDGDHMSCRSEPIHSQPVVSDPVRIGRDVWIGAFSVVLKGASIPDGVVIGAKSLVLQSSSMIPYSINVGSPVRRIAMRADDSPPAADE
ncbi:hypothetical protein D3OALGA1CA_4634 [Olavius algarvensis associated proteobacterium Delta 3]|nr:hypothetical protein D3OALGB2SA_4823 [Olavius algarvensis associated proteobacterium Delta 3]CAB5154499.1 hypothetical protein D3OALGA1CA_4634 [Olavius algarvensis associated proteobacterium Delta 3]